MIETPTAVAYLKTETVRDDGDADAPLLTEHEKQTTKEAEVLLVKTQPITASFRTTIQHLRARAGFFSRFRGVKVAAVITFLHVAFTLLLTGLFSVPFLGEFLSCIILAPLSLTWNHVIISEPSAREWYRRIPGVKSLRKILPATAIFAAAQQLTTVLPAILAQIFGLPLYLEDPTVMAQVDEAGRKAIVRQVVIVSAVYVATSILILVPASVTLSRVQASLLPEQDEAIVPFDRTFGGKVVPEAVGGSGVLGVVDAWRTFDWAARIRLMKVYIKVTMMSFAITMLFGAAIYDELSLIMGDILEHQAFQVFYRNWRNGMGV